MRMMLAHQREILASEYQDHTPSPSARQTVVRAHHTPPARVHRIPLLTSVTTANRPLPCNGMDGQYC
ncbi:hypothetical protein BRAS3843_1120006 [Bradyrhizobium sp. STM 3843]|nr:hypothetical protein BRAS3843_1120006 [Bradyrhizobium sp. STM 3843]